VSLRIYIFKESFYFFLQNTLYFFLQNTQELKSRTLVMKRNYVQKIHINFKMNYD